MGGTILLFIVLISGCSDASGPVDPSGRNSRSTAPPALRLAGLDGKFAQVAQQAPGFGGIFYDENGRLTIVLRDRSQSSRAKQAIAAILPENRGRLIDAQIVDGRFGFLQLAAWHEQVREVLSIPGVVFTDIDERRNQLVIGIQDEALRSQIAGFVSSRHVPQEAFAIVQREPLSFAATLRDRVRGVGGGLQIDVAVGTGGECTLGYNTIRWTEDFQLEYVFVTNSHCTSIRGGVESTAFYQSTAGQGTHLIGYEIADPHYWSGSPCPLGRRCRYSDSALGRYNSSSDSRGGVIAFTYSRNQFSAGSIQIADWMGIQSHNPRPLLNQQMDKVGRTSGWTYGPVTQACSNENVQGTDITLLCQYVVAGYADFGDSGAPVFYYDPTPLVPWSAVGQAHLYGILWGVGPGAFGMSPLEQVEQELGL